MASIADTKQDGSYLRFWIAKHRLVVNGGRTLRCHDMPPLMLLVLAIRFAYNPSLLPS